MLLPSSPVHATRLRRLALCLALLGVLLLVVALGLRAWQRFQAQRQFLEFMQRVFQHAPVEASSELPFLTWGSQGRVYAPGQTALAFVEGFQPHEALFVRLYHRTQGLLEAAQTRADQRGQLAAARSLSLDGDGANFTPPGSLWFQVEGLNGKSQEYSFRLEPGPAKQTPPGKGVYPASAAPDSLVVLWCSGNKPGVEPMADVQVDGESVRPEALHLAIYPTAPDGLLLARLSISLNDPTGQWTVFLGACELHFTVGQAITLSH